LLIPISIPFEALPHLAPPKIGGGFNPLIAPLLDKEGQGGVAKEGLGEVKLILIK